MTGKQTIYLLFIMAALLFSGCKKVDNPLDFATTSVEMEYSYGAIDNETGTIPLTVTVNCEAMNHPDYAGSLADFTDVSLWEASLNQANSNSLLDDLDEVFPAQKGLSASFVQNSTVYAGDVVVFELNGAFEITLSEDLTKIYTVEKVDTLFVPAYN